MTKEGLITIHTNNSWYSILRWNRNLENISEMPVPNLHIIWPHFWYRDEQTTFWLLEALFQEARWGHLRDLGQWILLFWRQNVLCSRLLSEDLYYLFLFFLGYWLVFCWFDNYWLLFCCFIVLAVNHLETLIEATYKCVNKLMSPFPSSLKPIVPTC